jgi:hypothetical protein
LLLHACAVGVAPLVTLLPLRLPLHALLLLLLAVERVALDVVGPRPKRIRHLRELRLFGRCEGVRVGRLYAAAAGAHRREIRKQLLPQGAHLLLDLLLVEPAGNA